MDFLDENNVAIRNQRILEEMSISELEDYIENISAEIDKVRAIIKSKKHASSAAELFFKE